jgi:hypothetical protein
MNRTPPADRLPRSTRAPRTRLQIHDADNGQLLGLIWTAETEDDEIAELIPEGFAGISTSIPGRVVRRFNC